MGVITIGIPKGETKMKLFRQRNYLSWEPPSTKKALRLCEMEYGNIMRNVTDSQTLSGYSCRQFWLRYRTRIDQQVKLYVQLWMIVTDQCVWKTVFKGSMMLLIEKQEFSKKNKQDFTQGRLLQMTSLAWMISTY